MQSSLPWPRAHGHLPWPVGESLVPSAKAVAPLGEDMPPLSALAVVGIPCDYRREGRRPPTVITQGGAVRFVPRPVAGLSQEKTHFPGEQKTGPAGRAPRY